MEKDIDQTIEELDDTIHDMEPAEMERTVKAMSPEGMALRAERRKVRYQLYRIQTEFLGGAAAESSPEIRERFERHPLFGGWRFFAVTWDVDFTNPYEIVHRDHSVADEWQAIVEAKFPVINPETGGVSYPDIKVKQKIEAEAKRRKKKG